MKLDEDQIYKLDIVVRTLEELKTLGQEYDKEFSDRLIENLQDFLFDANLIVDKIF